MIVTDHSPCPPEMKRLDTGRFDQAWGGIASLSLALSIIHTEAQTRGFTLDHIVRWMSQAPASLAGLSHKTGALAPNREANFVIFDTETTFIVTPDKLHYRHAISPYLNETLRGQSTPHGSAANPSTSSNPALRTDTPRGASSSYCMMFNLSDALQHHELLTRWNALDPVTAAREILPCCGSQAWAAALAAKRPIADEPALMQTSAAIWQSLPEAAWQQAFDSHPRIGQQHAQRATEQSLRWSAQEQSAAISTGDSSKQALAEANRRYEEKFHRIFIVCANGSPPPKSSPSSNPE